MKLTSTLVFLFLSMIAFAQPSNDTPCNSQLIEVDGTPIDGDNTEATADANEVVPPAATGGYSCINSWCNDDMAVQNSMWYSFVAPSNGAVVISTCNAGSELDTQIALWMAEDCSDYVTYTNLAANDDLEGGCTDGGVYSSGISIDGLTPGASYLIQVDGWDGEMGPFVLTLATGQPSSLVNIIHTSADTALAVVDIRLDGALLFDNLNFLSCSQYLPIDASGPHTLSVHPATSEDGDPALTSTEINLDATIDYEVALIGLSTEIGFSPSQPLQLSVFSNAMQYTAVPGSIPLRFLHASTDAPMGDFLDAETSTILANDISFGTQNSEGYQYYTTNFTLAITDASGNATGLNYCVPAGFIADFGLGYCIAAVGFLTPANNSNGLPIGLYLVDWTSGDLLALESGACSFPDNDNLCTATTLVVNDAPTVADNSFATLEVNESTPINLAGNDPESDCINAWCDGTLDNTLWYSFEAPPSGCVFISTCFADGIIDTQIALCTAEDCTDPSTVDYIAANDDMEAACDGNTYSSELSYCGLTPGATYYIQTDGYEGELGGFYIQVTEPLSVDDTEKNTHTTYPNPAREQLFVEGLGDGGEIEIVHLTGRTVFRGKYNQAGIDVSTLPAGSYVMRVIATETSIGFIKL